MPKYIFTNNWFPETTAWWTSLFQQFTWPNSTRTIVEIGSFEGQSSCWILENLIQGEKDKLYCLDTFEGGIEHTELEIKNLYDRFVHNITETGKAAKVEICQGPSSKSLSIMNSKNLKADFIYIDGSHQSPDVISDLVGAWHILNIGGMVICDDYMWKPYNTDITSCPKMAIDSFTSMFWNKLRPIVSYQNYQAAFIKCLN